MRRMLIVFLSTLLTVLLCACGGESTQADAPGAGSQSRAEANVTHQKSADVETIQEQILLDEDGIAITAKGLDKAGMFGTDLKVLIENNSEKDITVQVRASSVNGYMVETMFSADVSAGKKVNDSITFMRSDLEQCGIDTIADMEFYFHIFDGDWDTVLDSEIIKLSTSASDSYTYTFDDSGDELCNESGIRILSKGFSEDESIFGPGLVLFIENNTEDAITVQSRDVSVNGFMVDTIFSEDVSAGKRSICAVTMLDSSLEENEIEKIENMELIFHVFYQDGWDDLFDTDVITITAS